MSQLYIHYSLTTLNLPNFNAGPVNFTTKLKVVNMISFTFSLSPNNFIIWRMRDNSNFAVYHSLLLQIPSGERSYDPNTKVWTIRKEKFDTIFQFFDATAMILHGDITNDIVKGWTAFDAEDEERRKKQKAAPAAEEFFYHYSQPTTTRASLSLDDLVSKITQLILDAGISETDLSVAYKKAVRKLHPDVNNGDGSRMSELNMYWQQLKQLQSKN